MRNTILFLILVAALAVITPSTSSAEGSVCSTVKLEILQELTLERIAFDAKLKVTNNTDQTLIAMRVDILIRDRDGNNVTDRFFVRDPELTNNMGGTLKGDSSVNGHEVGEAHWLIIPKTRREDENGDTLEGAGGTDPEGTRYWVGASMTYVVSGTGETEVVPILPVSILVKPDALLYLDYFQPHEVLGDNPFTPQTEPSVPFKLAVRVLNDGYGPANKLKIESQQPTVTSNDQQLLYLDRILGTAVNGWDVNPSLTADFGTLDPKSAASAYWLRITSLSGVFEDFEASFTHASELGGEMTSIIQGTEMYYLIHMVKNVRPEVGGIPASDNMLDFLATDSPTGGTYNLFESELPEGGDYDTNGSSEVEKIDLDYNTTVKRPSKDNPYVELKMAKLAGQEAIQTGFVYLTDDDPSAGMMRLISVTRDDGRVLDQNNFWVDVHEVITTGERSYDVGLFDTMQVGEQHIYSLRYEEMEVDETAPTTTLVFSEPNVVWEDGTKAFVRPSVDAATDINVGFLAEDNEGGSGVFTTWMRFDGNGDFQYSYPLAIMAEDTSSLEYYSEDRAGKIEDTKQIEITVDGSAPGSCSILPPDGSFKPGAPDFIDAPKEITFTLNAIDQTGVIHAVMEISNGTDSVTLESTGESETGFDVVWDGRDENGDLMPKGAYTVSVVFDDGLENETTPVTATVTIQDWFEGELVCESIGRNQSNPAICETMVVWQEEDGNGGSNIHVRDLNGTCSSNPVAAGTNPAVGLKQAGVYNIAWQSPDNKVKYADTGNLATIGDADSSSSYDQENPSISDNWVAWQDNRDGNWDIWVYNIGGTEGPVQVTGVGVEVRDQINPCLAGDKLYWEDYQNGLADVYYYPDLENLTSDPDRDLIARLTDNYQNQSIPDADGQTVVWMDQRGSGKDIYAKPSGGGEFRLTYGSGDEAEPAVYGDIVAYTDYDKGYEDPEIAVAQMSQMVGAVLTNGQGRQDQPDISDSHIVWRDCSGENCQIYFSLLNTIEAPIKVDIRPGFNLIAVGGLLAGAYPSSDMLLGGLDVNRVMVYDAEVEAVLERTYDNGALSGYTFNLTIGSGLVLYAGSEFTLTIAEGGAETPYTLKQGVNQIGMLKVPFGYTSYDMIESIGLGNIRSVRRYDPVRGAWETASVRGELGTNGETDNMEIVGEDFPVRPGEGLIVTMDRLVLGWKP